MTPSSNSQRIFYALSIAWQLGFILAIFIGGSLLFGLWADRRLGTLPLLMIFCLIAGILLATYECYRLFFPLLKNKKND